MESFRAFIDHTNLCLPNIGRISLKRKCERDVEALTTNTFCRKWNPLNIYKRHLVPYVHVHLMSICNRLRGLVCLVWFSDLHISVLNSVFDFCHHCVANGRVLGPVVESAIAQTAICLVSVLLYCLRSSMTYSPGGFLQRIVLEESVRRVS